MNTAIQKAASFGESLACWWFSMLETVLVALAKITVDVGPAKPESNRRFRCPRCEGVGVYNFHECAICDGVGSLAYYEDDSVRELWGPDPMGGDEMLSFAEPE